MPKPRRLVVCSLAYRGFYRLDVTAGAAFYTREVMHLVHCVDDGGAVTPEEFARLYIAVADAFHDDGHRGVSRLGHLAQPYVAKDVLDGHAVLGSRRVNGEERTAFQV